MDFIDTLLIICIIVNFLASVASFIMHFTDTESITDVVGIGSSTSSVGTAGTSGVAGAVSGLSDTISSNLPNPYPNTLSLVSPSATRQDGKDIVPKDLGYTDGSVNSGNFQRGYYNLDGTGANNYCRFVGIPPKEYLACTKDDQEYYYTTAGLDRGYEKTRGIFKLPLSRSLAYCRGVGDDVNNAPMACIPIKNDAFDKDDQYYLRGKVGNAPSYF